MGTAGGVNVFRNRGRADKANGFDAGVGEQGIYGFFVAVHHIQNAWWQTSLECQLSDTQGAAGIAF